MYTDLAVVVLAGLLGPLAFGRRLWVPVLVADLIGGILLGRTALRPSATNERAAPTE